jgi:CheY-like chemotaxis protein
MSNKIKILVVDDEIKASILLKMNLDPLGFEVSIAVTGKEGLNKATAEKPDLIILDIRMPEMDGWEVSNRLKLNPETRDIPIMILSAFSNTAYINRANELGINAYLVKPVAPDRLAKLIPEIIKNKEPQPGIKNKLKLYV